MAQTDPPIAITAGEPAGIGPDLCVILAQRPRAWPLVAIADSRLLAARARMLGLPLAIVEFDAQAAALQDAGALSVLHTPIAAPVTAGQLDPRNSRYVLRTLALAVDGCRDGRFRAMVTAPVHKGAINDAGIPFTGHTEFIAERTATPQVVMMLVGGGMRVALATTHLALNKVAAHISRELLEAVLRVLRHDLVTRFGCARPRIAVAGLNPHAGESGHLGHEEIDAIVPAIETLRAEGLDVEGPLPADTLFNRERLASIDCVLAMYHDQGLPVLKYASFGSGVNITLGLPIIRTSVDHGTALELAGTGKIDSGSLLAAVELAAQLAANRLKNTN